MTTKEVIKQLKKEDPSGKLHVRAGGGTVICFERKPGYWDGSYQYVDKEGNFVITNQGEKVDIIYIDYEEWIWDHDGDYSKIKLDFGASCNPKDEEKTYLERFEQISRKCKSTLEHSLHEFTINMLKQYKEGFTVAQPKTEKIGRYNVMWFYKDDQKGDRLRQGDCGAVLKSGFFEPVERGDLIYWELNL